jgi:hypothetical protein
MPNVDEMIRKRRAIGGGFKREEKRRSAKKMKETARGAAVKKLGRDLGPMPLRQKELQRRIKSVLGED